MQLNEFGLVQSGYHHHFSECNWSRHVIADNCLSCVKQQSLTHSLTKRNAAIIYLNDEGHLGQVLFYHKIDRLWQQNITMIVM